MLEASSFEQGSFLPEAEGLKVRIGDLPTHQRLVIAAKSAENTLCQFYAWEAQIAAMLANKQGNHPLAETLESVTRRGKSIGVFIHHCIYRMNTSPDDLPGDPNASSADLFVKAFRDNIPRGYDELLDSISQVAVKFPEIDLTGDINETRKNILIASLLADFIEGNNPDQKITISTMYGSDKPVLEEVVYWKYHNLQPAEIPEFLL